MLTKLKSKIVTGRGWAWVFDDGMVGHVHYTEPYPGLGVQSTANSQAKKVVVITEADYRKLEADVLALQAAVVDLAQYAGNYMNPLSQGELLHKHAAVIAAAQQAHLPNWY